MYGCSNHYGLYDNSSINFLRFQSGRKNFSITGYNQLMVAALSTRV